MKKKLSILSSIVLAAGLLAACGDDSKDNSSSSNGSAGEGLESKIVTIATGGASGPYNIIGTTLADIYTNEYDVNSRTQTTGSSVENLNLINQGKVEMAFVMSDALSQAINGEVSFKEKIESVSTIATLYPNVVQIITKADSGIKTVEDLKGKRVAVGDQNSGVEVNARTILNGHGITYDDIKVDYLGYAEAADGLSAGTIDAAFLTSGIPNASVMELSETLDITLVSVDPKKVEEIAKDHPYFISFEIKPGVYSNKESIFTAAVPNALVVRKDLSEDDVYKLTKTFFESLEKLSNSHQAANDISLEKGSEGIIGELHPGAKKFYDEQ
mgnify:CR=1 FL=1